jgi:hypothetical protein
LWILKPGRQAQPIRQIRLPSPMYTTPVAANGALYLATWTHLYAIGKPAKP